MRLLRPPASTRPWRGAVIGQCSLDSAHWTVLIDQSSSRIILFAAGLFDELHALDADVMRERLAHVVNGEGRDGGSGQRFHLNSSLVAHGHAASDDYGAAPGRFNLHRAIL